MIVNLPHNLPNSGTNDNRGDQILPDGFYLYLGKLQFIFDHRIKPSCVQPEVNMNWIRTYDVNEGKLFYSGVEEIPDALPVSPEDALKQRPHMIERLGHEIDNLRARACALQNCLDVMSTKCQPSAS